MTPDVPATPAPLPPVTRRTQRLPAIIVVQNAEGVVVNSFHRDYWLQATQEQVMRTVWWALNNQHQVTIRPPELE